MNRLVSLKDGELITLLKMGDKRAFEEIYNRYWLVIYRRFYKKLQCRDLSAEFTQELFASIWSRKEHLQISISLIHYLDGAVRKMVVSHVRREIRKRLTLSEQPLEDLKYELGDNSFEERIEMLATAINDLPEKTATILRLSKLEGMSVKAIAQNQDLSGKAIEYHITKALKLLRRFFQNRGDILLVIFTSEIFQV